jgi:multiple sugar transport system permease protein/sorbitol/mannitol transport system permease protein
MMPRRGRQLVLSIMLFVVLMVWSFPVFWGFVTSLKTDREVLVYPPIAPFHPILSNYAEVFAGHDNILPNLWSSLIVSVLTTTVTIALAVPAAYALARLHLRGRASIGFYILATQMLPPIGLVIPYFIIFSRVGLLNTYHGLILIDLTLALPFAIWLLVSYFEEIPREMEEAALIDRAGRVRALWYVILPQVRGGIAVTVVFVFLNVWNEFLFAVVLGGRMVRPVTVAMFNFISLEQTQWGRVSAAAMIAMAPVLLLGLAAQRHIVKGLTLGAVKGVSRR